MTKMRITQQVLQQSKLASYLAVVALTLLCQTAVVHAIGLGGMTVQSRLGQPFAAEIDLINVGRDDLASLKVNLAPPSAYATANLRFDPALNALRLSVERRVNGTPYVRAVSSRSVSEPYLDVLVEMTTQEGKFQRAYTALLDLPDTPAPAAAAAPVTKAQAEPARTPAPPRAVAKPPASDRTATATPAGPPAARPAARPPSPIPAAPGNNVLAKPVPGAVEPVRPEAAKLDKPALPKAEAAVTEPPKAEAPAAVPAKDASPAAQAPQAEATEPVTVADAEPPTPPAKKAAVPLAPSRGVGDFISANALSLGGGVLALLAAIVGLWAWRRRSPAPEAVVPAPSESVLQAPMPLPRAATPAVVAPLPAAPVAVAAPSDEASPPELSVAGVTDIVDPIDEAKVHLDYGQSEQAEKILREALSKQPGREDMQLLLLEILAGRRDNDGFNQLAGRIHRQTGGLGEHWKRVMAMGYALDPGYALYSPTEAAHGAPVPAPEQRDDLVRVPESDDSGAGDLDKTVVLPRAAARAPAEPLPDLAFELPSAAPAGVAAAETPAAAPVTPDHPGLDFKVDLPASSPQLEIAADSAVQSDSQHEEVQKKLMLARAYREMGDKEGALELLREVEREGDAAQLAEMREIMQTLD